MNQEQWKKELGLRKLERLANFLKTLPKKKFNFDVIGTCDAKNADKTKTAKCCTAACALGWATVLWPKKMKMHVYDTDDSKTYTNVSYDDVYDDFEAGEKLFSISYDESRYLFDPWCRESVLSERSTNTQVANHILKFVKEKRKELKANV